MFWRLMLRFWREGVWVRLLGAAVVVLILEVSPVPRSLLLALDRAGAAARSGDYAGAAEAYHQAYLYQPWVFDHLAAAAEAELHAGRYDEAEHTLNALAALRPLRAEEMLWLGSIYAGQGRIEAAVLAWEEARFWGAADTGSMTQLTDIYLARGEWRKAAQALEALAELAPADADLHYRLGLIQALDDPDKAAISLATAASLDLQLAERLIPLRASLFERPTQPPDLAYARLGVLDIGLEEWALAEEALSRAVALNPAYGEALAYLAYVRVRLGKPGLGAAQQALALSPDSPLVHYLAGLTWKEYGRPLEARAAFEQAYSLDPRNPAFAVEIASTYRTEHAFEWAELWMNQAVHLAGDDLRFHILRVQFYVDEEYRVEEVGLPLALELVEKAPEDAQARDALGWAYFLVGEREKAAQELDQALALDPKLARAHVHLGMLLEVDGLPHRAVPHYRRASALEPDGPFGAMARRALERLGGEG
jgi:tetratricopeptide (TPR) repeat protein